MNSLRSKLAYKTYSADLTQLPTLSKGKVHLDRIFYISLSGSHSYGTARKGSDIDLRGVWVPELSDSLNLTGKSSKGIHVKIDGNDLEMIPIKRFLYVTLRGNGNYLESLFEKKLFPSIEDSIDACGQFYEFYNNHWALNRRRMINDLQKSILHYGLNRSFKEHYLRFAQSQKDDFYKDYKVKCLLYTYRVLMAGIVLFREKRVEYNLSKLLKHYDSTYVKMLLSKYDLGQSLVNEPVLRQIEKEVEVMERDLQLAYEESDLPEKPNWNYFEEWLANLYVHWGIENEFPGDFGGEFV